MENAEIRMEARKRGVPVWKIARELGISEQTLYRWLRVPISDELEKAMREIIERLSVR